MSILTAIGKILAALTALVVVWCECLGRFIIKCMPGYVPLDPGEVVEAYDDAAAAVDVAPGQDVQLARIQAAADLMFREQPVPGELMQGVSEKTVRWLALLDGDMLNAVARANLEALADHLGSRQTLRGVLRCEDDAMEAYQAAVAKRTAPEPEISYGRRRSGREPVLPAFEPMC